jgi:hypothetical protein
MLLLLLLVMLLPSCALCCCTGCFIMQLRAVTLFQLACTQVARRLHARCTQAYH